MAYSDFIEDSESTDDDCCVFFICIGLPGIITHWRSLRRENIEANPEDTSYTSRPTARDDGGGIFPGETTDRYSNGSRLVQPPKSWHLHSFIQSTSIKRSAFCFRSISCLLFAFLMTGVDCRILDAPQNLAVIRDNKDAMMKCKGDREDSLLVWYANVEKGPVKHISVGDRMNPTFQSKFQLNTSFSGQYDLSIQKVRETALKYTCFEPSSGDIESAELIILDEKPTCSNDSLENGNVTMNCAVKVFGNWLPKIIWTGNNSEMLNGTFRRDADVISSTLIVSGTDRGGTYTCTIKFCPDNKPSDTTAAECPAYVFTESWKVEDYDDAVSTKEEHKETETGSQHLKMDPIIIIGVTLVAMVLLVIVAILFICVRYKKRNPLKVCQEESLPVM